MEVGQKKVREESSQLSKSLDSALTEKRDPIVNTWANRPLNTTDYPYIFADAMYIKVREHHRVESKAVYIATAINEQNGRENLGLKVDHSESFEAWQRFFQYLQSRGLQSPKLIISDAHKGLKKAITEEFVGTTWKSCTEHFKRNIFNKLPKKDMNEVKIGLKRIFEAIKIEDARIFKEEFLKSEESRQKKVREESSHCPKRGIALEKGERGEFSVPKMWNWARKK